MATQPTTPPENDCAIEVDGVGKAYRIWRDPASRLKFPLLRALGSVLPKALQPRALRRRIGESDATPYYRDFFALKDISFTVRRGEAVGIIGRNGSGKSTLLQIIAGTLNPTTGTAKVHGRVAALLELGSGFNPEFTGRENVYLNASILGLSREETDQRFNDIAAFADIGDFIDQPVKTYSSGMTMRLAFAVIAHVDAETLIIDEALSVGDALFTQKCMRFIREYTKHHTLLFVSHDSAAVRGLCARAIWLHEGCLKIIGPADKTSEAYLKHTLQETYADSANLNSTGETEDIDENIPLLAVDHSMDLIFHDNLSNARGFKTGLAELISISLHLDSNPNESITVLEGNEVVILKIRARAYNPLTNAILGFLVKDRLGQDLFGENTLQSTASRPCMVNAGCDFSAEFSFRMPMLPNGEYAVFASVADGTLHENIQHHLLHNACILKVSSSTVRWGLVGIPILSIALNTINVSNDS